MRCPTEPHIELAELVCCAHCKGESRYNGTDNDTLCTCATDCKQYTVLHKLTKPSVHGGRVFEWTGDARAASKEPRQLSFLDIDDFARGNGNW